MRELFAQILIFLATAAGLGIIAHFAGEALPRSRFDPENALFCEKPFEKNGRFYEKLGIKRWKDKLPDKSRVKGGGYSKSMKKGVSPEHIDRLIKESCVAEFVHLSLAVASPVFLVTMRGVMSAAATVLYALHNVPYIMIQRYNRPRLKKTACALERRADAMSAGAQAV